MRCGLVSLLALALALLAAQGCRSLAGHGAATVDAQIPDDADLRGDAHTNGDGREDARAPDTTAPDTTAPDTTATSGGPCVFGVSRFEWRSDMVMCSAGGPVTQCGAAAACSPGWTLCTASQYLARGGKTTAPPVTEDNAWLSGCVRSGGPPHAPTDSPCPGACLPDSAPIAPVAWYCTFGSFQRGDAYLAVLTRTKCRRVGINSASTQAFWSFRATDRPRSAVVCCK